MNCKACKNEIPDGSIYCLFCGAKLVRDAKREISVPKARNLPSGKWHIQLRLNGQSVSITEDTEAKATAKARAVKEGMIALRQKPEDITFRQAIDRYLKDNDSVLSPPTIRGYRAIQNHRFQSVMDKKINTPCRWQALINAEVKDVSPKTVRNAWALLTRVMRVNGIDVPDVNLPSVPKTDQPFLDPDQIKVFLAAINGQPDELAALLALHSLRRSELGAVTPADIDLKKNIIHVRGAVVMDEHHHFVTKETNKNETSTRTVPIMIPRLKELLKGRMGEDRPVIQTELNHLSNRINSVCEAALLPLVGVHGLRRSFASLAYHLKWPTIKTMQTGGWSDINTVLKIYTYLSTQDGKQADKSMAKFYKNANKNAYASKKS